MTLLNALNSICSDISLVLKSPAFSELPSIKPNGTRIDIFLKNPPDKISARDKLINANDIEALTAYNRLTSKISESSDKDDAFLFFYKVFGDINLIHKMVFSPEFKWNTQSFVDSSFEIAIKFCFKHSHSLGTKFFHEFISCPSNWPGRWKHEYENIVMMFIGKSNAAFLWTNHPNQTPNGHGTWHKNKKDLLNDTHGFFCDADNFKDIFLIATAEYNTNDVEQNAFILKVRNRWINWQSIIRRNLYDSFLDASNNKFHTIQKLFNSFNLEPSWNSYIF